MPTSTDFRLFNVLTVRDSEKSEIVANRKSTTAFQQAIDGVHALSLSPPKGGSKTIFLNKFNFSQIKSATEFLCVKLPVAKL